MKLTRSIARWILIAVFSAVILADVIAPAPYDEQFRDSINAPPSNRFPLGTDELGRDRFSRLLHGTRVSLLLAPAAALLGTLLAGVAGVAAGFVGGWWERLTVGAADLCVSLPWMFLLITVRATLPLNVSPLVSVTITFLLLGLLGWAGPARVVRTGARALRHADFVVQARAYGCSRWRLLLLHLLPNLKPLLWAQFWLSIPVFIISEANLSLLGLGVAEPMPSWGNLLRELENYSAVLSNPWMAAPAVLLVIVVACFHLILSREDFPA